mgnify:CR=1 FL=1
MRWFRVELAEDQAEPRRLDDGTILVTDSPEIVWKHWFGEDPCHVWEVEGDAVKEWDEWYEDENGARHQTRAAFVVPRRVRLVKTLGE